MPSKHRGQTATVLSRSSLSHTHRHTAVVINCSDYGGSRCIHGGSGAVGPICWIIQLLLPRRKSPLEGQMQSVSHEIKVAVVIFKRHEHTL